MILPEISAYLVANTTRFIAAPSTHATKYQVWLNKFPAESQDSAVALFESGGIEPIYTYEGLSNERPTMQVISRSHSYDTARDNANAIFTLLAGTENATLSNVSYTKITPVQSPFDLGTDAAERNMVSCNFTAEKAVSPT